MTSRASARLGDAANIARALSTVAWILARLRMIDVVHQAIHVTVGHEGDLRDVELPECLPECLPLSEHDRPAQPDLEDAEGECLEQGGFFVGAGAPDLVVVATQPGIAVTCPAAARLPVSTR